MDDNKPVVVAGMLRPGFSIGHYTLRDSYSGKPGTLWIDGIAGEGGEFDAAALEAVLHDFYTRNF